MDKDVVENLLIPILASATVSSIISGVFLFLSERSKRISEEKRVKMETAAKLTELHDNKVRDLMKISRKTLWRNHAHTFYNFYTYVERVWKTGEYDGDNFDSPIPK